MGKSTTWVAFLILVAALAPLTFGQATDGNVVGTVVDSSGAAVPNVTVTVTNIATGVKMTTTSSVSGEYRLNNLPIGSYNLNATASGFGPTTLANISVALNQTVTANITLRVGEVTTVVEVTEAQTVIDTTTSQVQTSFDSRQLADLPSAATGSGVINLSLISAGVSSSGAIGVGTGPSVGGQRPRNNNFTIEGVDNNNKSVTGPLVQVPNDAVAEFTLLENQFSPEFGHSAGGQFNQVVKSGTNDFHGAVYEYLMNRNLNAADQQAVVSGTPLHPRYDNNRFGGDVGGPIKKNKIFFFGAYEYNPVGEAGAAGQIFAPTSNGYNTLAGISGLSQNNLAIMKQYLPPAGSAADPSTTPGGAYPLVGGQAVELGLASVSKPSYINNMASVGSIDYNISDKDSLRGRFILNRTSLIDNAADLPTFFTQIPYHYYFISLSEFHNFTPTLTNELRIGFNRYYNITGVGSQQFPGLDAFPNLTVDELGVNIGPDGNAPQETIQNTYQGTDNVSWVKGAHTLKFGVEFRKMISPQTFTQRGRGDYEWSTLEGYLTDQIPDFAQRTLGNVVYYGDQIQFGTYINDDWKIKPSFTINLGLRYERTTLPYSERLQSVNSISSLPGLISFNEPKVQNKNFMPRVGFAWSPGGRGTTSIRGGFGINYDQLFDNLGILSLPPQFNITKDVSGLAGGNFLATGGIPPNAQTGTLSQADARANTGGFIPDQRLPKAIQWNIGIQHVFRGDYTVEVRYLGTRGIQLPMQDRIDVQSVVTPQNALPVYMSAPSQSQLDSLTNTYANLVNTYNNGGYLLPQYLNNGFYSPIVGFMPVGSSTYHGLATQVRRRFSNGLQFIGAYTWSHNIDDSTAEVFSTVTTARRPQDFQNLRPERASSALDHRQRFTMALVYDLPFFKNGNWFMKNVVGNWEVAPIYTYQTGTLVTVLSEVDSNLNTDAYTDRAIVNPSGTVNVGSGTTPLLNSNGDRVAYLVNDPSARYIQVPKGALPNGGRNTQHLMPIDNIDMSLLKRFNMTERFKLELGGRFFNLLNHSQYVSGYLSDVAPLGYTGTQVRNFLNPSDVNFYRPDAVFSNNPRSITVSAKITF